MIMEWNKSLFQSVFVLFVFVLLCFVFVCFSILGVSPNWLLTLYWLCTGPVNAILFLRIPKYPN